MLVVMTAVVGLATIRKLDGLAHVVPVTSSFGINLYLGNLPPPEVHVTAVDVTARVFEYARKAPRAFLHNLTGKAL